VECHYRRHRKGAVDELRVRNVGVVYCQGRDIRISADGHPARVAFKTRRRVAATQAADGRGGLNAWQITQRLLEVVHFEQHLEVVDLAGRRLGNHRKLRCLQPSPRFQESTRARPDGRLCTCRSAQPESEKRAHRGDRNRVPPSPFTPVSASSP
jgi:hypothetical protein